MIEPVMGAVETAVQSTAKQNQKPGEVNTSLGKLYSADAIQMRYAVDNKLLLELVEIGSIPHYRLQGYDEPLFQLGEVKDWISENLFQHFIGTKLPKPIFPVISREPNAKNLPDTLSAVDGLKEIPAAALLCGIYFLVKNNEVVYVGQSQNLLSRIGAHYSEGQKEFDRVLYLIVPRSQLNEVESGFIKSLNPPMNKAGKGVSS